MSLPTKVSLLFASLAAAAGCAAPVQSVTPTGEGAEWRRRADASQGKYEELDKQVRRLLGLLPRATASVDAAQLQRTYLDNREVPELVRALEKQVGAARDNADSGRYHAVVRCGAGRDDGSFSMSLLRKGAKPKAKGARIKLVDRGVCPSQYGLDIAPQQIGEGEFRFEVAFESRPGRPYQFAFELRRLDGDKDDVVCSGGTSAGGPPTLSNACDLSLKLPAPSELPVAR